MNDDIKKEWEEYEKTVTKYSTVDFNKMSLKEFNALDVLNEVHQDSWDNYYAHLKKVNYGEWYDMQHLTCQNWPNCDTEGCGG